MAIQNGRCFYDESHDMASPEVDHVLPWSFVLEDKTWNLVLACRKCNNEKRDRLANIDALESLCARNEKIANGHHPCGTRLSVGTLRNGIRGILSSHIKGLYDQAVATDFQCGSNQSCLFGKYEGGGGLSYMLSGYAGAAVTLNNAVRYARKTRRASDRSNSRLAGSSEAEAAGGAEGEVGRARSFRLICLSLLATAEPYIGP